MPMQGQKYLNAVSTSTVGNPLPIGSNHWLTLTAEAIAWGGATVIIQIRTGYTDIPDEQVLGIDDETILGIEAEVMLGISSSSTPGGWITLPYTINSNAYIPNIKITPGCQARAILLNASETTDSVTVCIG